MQVNGESNLQEENDDYTPVGGRVPQSKKLSHLWE